MSQQEGCSGLAGRFTKDQPLKIGPTSANRSKWWTYAPIERKAERHKRRVTSRPTAIFLGNGRLQPNPSTTATTRSSFERRDNRVLMKWKRPRFTISNDSDFTPRLENVGPFSQIFILPQTTLFLRYVKLFSIRLSICLHALQLRDDCSKRLMSFYSFHDEEIFRCRFMRSFINR